MEAHLSNLMFRAFADETRLRLLHLLVDGEMCVGDLVTILDLPQPTVSRHLASLRRAELVESRSTGVWRHYRLSAPKSPLHEHLIGTLGTCFRDVQVLRDDAERAARLRVEGGCCPDLTALKGLDAK